MNNIQLLNTNLVDQISAGEVIDRPASVLKELIENSIDSGAHKITIKIIKGGHDLIYVKDNGCGMDMENLRIAFKRHATSKIFSVEDLYCVKTLGFGGEGLPSIASVSKLVARSSENGTNTYEISLEGGKEKSLLPVSGLKGSVFSTKNLFYNTPARKKFLKSPQTEQSINNDVLRRYMLSHTNIAFKVDSNNKLIYDVQKEDLSKRIKSIYGKKYYENILPVKLSKSHFEVSGYTGNLSLNKKRQGHQYLFINGRYIKSRMINSAVYSAYKSLISRGEFPFFILFISLPYEEFDVNVHPSKLEVRFNNEWQIYHIVKSSILQSLNSILKTIPKYNISYTGRSSEYGYQDNQFMNISPDQTHFHTLDNPPHHQLNREEKKSITNLSSDYYEKSHMFFNVDEMKENRKNDLESVSENIWQIHKKYLITEIKNGLIIIDQHVAHERILFEEAKKALEGSGLPSQAVLFPKTLQFQPEEYEILMDIGHHLNKIGFRFREFGENTIIIEGIPASIDWGNESQIIREIVDQYLHEKNIDTTFIDKLAAIYACKSAVKSGDSLMYEESKKLIDRLFSTDHPYYCPHGRPIIVNLSINELDIRFERK